MQGSGVTAVRQCGLEKRSIIIEFCRLRYGHSVQGDATLTEERMRKVIRHSLEVRLNQSRLVRLCRLAANIEFYI